MRQLLQQLARDHDVERGDRVRIMPFGTDAATQIATQTILHDGEHPSAVTLPVIPG